jgi:hypothetical protein
LKDDTGASENAKGDRRTKDPSVRGTVSGGPVVLRARVNHGNWRDISNVLASSGVFEISEELLKTLANGSLSDGRYRVDVETRFSELQGGMFDRAFAEFDLDRTSPSANIIGSAVISSAGTIEIPFSETLDAASVRANQVSLNNVSWGETSDDPNWGSDGNRPPFPVQLISVRVSDDSQRLLVKFADDGRSARYRLDLRNVVEDRAGNPFNGKMQNDLWSVEANKLSKNALALTLGETYRNLLQFEPRILEYKFALDSPKTLLWSGDLGIGSVARYELLDEYGEVLRQFLPGTTQEPGDAQRPTLIPLPPGEYRLRVAEPPLSLSFFRVEEQSQLPPLPSERLSGNVDLRPWDAYSVELTNDERVFVQSLDGQAILRHVFDPLGREMVKSRVGTNEYFDVSLAGKYTVIVNRAGYRIHRSRPIEIEVVDSGIPISGTFHNPGQKAQYSIPVTSGSFYFLKSELDIGIRMNIDHNDGQVVQIGTQWLVRPFGGRLRIQFENMDASGSNPGFELKLDALSVSPLEIGEWATTPDEGHNEWYRLPIDKVVGFEGEHEFTFITSSPGQLTVQTGFGSTVYRPQAQLIDNVLVQIRGVASSVPWRASLPNTVTNNLVFDTANQIEFVTGLETFEFEFIGEHGEFFNADLKVPSQSLLGTLSLNAIQLVDPTGRTISKVDRTDPGTLWKLEKPGRHRLQLTNSDGINATGQAFLVARRGSSWPELSLLSEQLVAPMTSQFYSIPPSIRSLALDPFTGNGSHGLNWNVFDQSGHVLFGNYGAQLKLSWLDIPLGNQYFLGVSNSGYDPFEFRLLDGSINTYHAQLGESYNGQLQKRGERLQVNIELQRGQRVHWAGIPWGTDGEVQAFLMDPNREFFDRKDFSGESYPTHWLVPATGVYSIELRNRSDSFQDVNFIVKLDSVPQLGSGLSGFDEVREGMLHRNDSNQGEVVFPFEVEADAAVFFDWLEDSQVPTNREFRVSISNAASGFYRELSIQDSKLVVFEKAGEYELKLSLWPGQDSGSYKFALLDLSDAPEIRPNQTIEGQTLGPSASRIYRLNVAEVSDLVLTRRDQSLVSVAVQSLFPGMQSTKIESLGSSTFARGTHAVVATSTSEFASEYSFKFGTVEFVSIDRENRVQIGGGVNRFQFEVQSSEMQVSVSLPISDAVVQAFNQSNVEMVRDKLGRFHLSGNGTYTLQVILPDSRSLQWADLFINNVPIEYVPYQLGLSIQRSELVQGEHIGYVLEIPNDGLYVWRIDGAENVQLADVNGRTTSLAQAVAENGLSVGPRVFQYLKAGSYSLQLSAAQNRVRLFIAALEDVPEIGLGVTSGLLESSDSERMFRFLLNGTDRLLLEAAVGTRVSFVTESMQSPNLAFPNGLVSTDYSQQLLIIARFNSNDALNGSRYQFSLTHSSNGTAIGVTVGEKTSVDLEPFQPLTVMFTLDSPRSLYFASNLSSFVLIYPNGTRRRFADTNAMDAWMNLPAGEYRINATISSIAQTVYATLHEFGNNASILDLPQSVSSPGGKLFRFEVAEAAEYFVVVRDEQSMAISNYSILDSFGTRLPVSERTSLNRGSYWFVVHSDNNFSSDLVPIQVHKIAAQVGELRQIEVTETRDIILQYLLSAGQLIDLPLVAKDAGVSIRFRIVPIGVSLGLSEGWSNIHSWPSSLFNKEDTVVEFLFSGKGESSISLIDYRQAPTLVFDHVHLLSHRAGYRRSVWRLEINELGPTLFSRLPLLQPNANWRIVNSIGETLQYPAEGITYSFGRTGEFYLEYEDSAISELNQDLLLEIVSL